MGPDEAKFTVQKTFLTKSSAFFETCCNGKWKEGETKTIPLPEDDPETFSTYLQWLYTGEVVVADGQDEDVPKDLETRVERTRPYYMSIMALAGFADKYNDVAFSNAVNDLLLNIMHKFRIGPGAACLIKAYCTLPKGSTTLALLADHFAAYADPEQLENDVSKYPPAFLGQVWITMRRRHKQCPVRVPSTKTLCYYQEHNEEVPKTAWCVISM